MSEHFLVVAGHSGSPDAVVDLKAYAERVDSCAKQVIELAEDPDAVLAALMENIEPLSPGDRMGFLLALARDLACLHLNTLVMAIVHYKELPSAFEQLSAALRQSRQQSGSCCE